MNRYLKLSFLTGLLVLGLVFTCAGKSLVLVHRGETPHYSVVIPSDATATERYAADEFVRYIERLTGVSLRVTHSAQGPAIRLERDSTLGLDAFSLSVRNRDLVIAGENRGLLYGVYELLETYGGVGWFSSWHEIVPRAKEFVVPGDLNRTEKPAFVYRETSWFDCREGDFAARLRLNGDVSKLEARHGKVNKTFANGKSHSLPVLVPPSKYFEEHPEYFAYDARVKKRYTKGYCLTNTNLFNLVMTNLEAVITKHPEASVVALGQPDFAGFCECEDCARITHEGGSRSAPLIKFVNAAAKELAKTHPNLLLETLAYQPTRQPPYHFTVEPNVLLCYCTMENDKSRSLEKSPSLGSADTRAYLQRWCEKANHKMVWNYTTYFKHYLFPYPNVLTLGDDIRYFRDHGVTWLTEQGAYQGRHGEFAELKAWLIAKFMWNPDQPLEPLLDRFFTGYYGKAAPLVRQYFDELHQNRLKWAGDDPKRSLNFIDPIDTPALDDAWLRKSEQLWREAERIAEKEGDNYLYNVKMSAISVSYALYLREPRKYNLCSASHPNAPDLAAKIERAKLLLSRIKEANIRIGEFSPNAGLMNQFELMLLYQLPRSSSAPKRLQTGPLIWTADWVNVSPVDDKTSPWKKCWLLTSKSKTKTKAKSNTLDVASFSADSFLYEPKVKYKFRVHLRADLLADARKDDPVFVFEITRRGKPAEEQVFTVRECSPTWKWMDVNLPPLDFAELDFSRIYLKKAYQETDRVGAQSIYIDSLEIIRQ